MITRTQEEIRHRLHQHAGASEDLFGFRRDLLINALDVDYARPFLQPDITAQQWTATGGTAMPTLRHTAASICGSPCTRSWTTAADPPNARWASSPNWPACSAATTW
ncbi:hypothetical protein [Salinispora arenicola]|uniref:hypothetical protein n=1 Tax=Salinispora arenicola TaxID=168697 RepID=UPI0012BB5EE7|nr:hypothetical protein [Salinispora arenicola]